MAKRFVIMGDVVGSGETDGSAVMDRLNPLVEHVQRRLGDSILSPLTITLGDEFQGVVADHQAIVRTIFAFEAERLARGGEIALRYAAAVGEIDTELNTETAHGMLGPALTTARRRLGDKSRSRRRFAFDLQSPDQSILFENLFDVLARRLEDWSPEESAYIAALVSDLDAAEIARLHDRDKTTVYRRRNSAPVQDYLALENAALAAARILDLTP